MNKNLFAALTCAFVALASCTPDPEEPARTRPLPPPPVQALHAHRRDRERRERFRARQHRLGNEDGPAGRADRREPRSTTSSAMTESSGWTSCTTPASGNTGDYDMVDRLIWRLRNGIGVTYRVAYMVGADGSFGWGRCRYYSGDTVLYNPNRITNLTPSDVAGRAQVPHNDNLLGFLVRRSLPICGRGARTNIPNLEQLIDGPPQFDRCNQPTPSAPVWAWQVRKSGGQLCSRRHAGAFRFGRCSNSSFDVVTTHPTSSQELSQRANQRLHRCADRSGVPKYQTLLSDDLLGDFNCLLDPPYECLPERRGRPGPGPRERRWCPGRRRT